MEATYKDENGEIKHYEISYSAEMQKRIEKKLKINNILLWVLIILLGALFLALMFRGTAGLILQKIACIGF